MTRFFKTNGINLTDMIKNLAEGESILLEMNEDSFNKSMKSVSATATTCGYKVEQTAIKGIECNGTTDKVINIIRVKRV